MRSLTNPSCPEPLRSESCSPDGAEKNSGSTAFVGQHSDSKGHAVTAGQMPQSSTGRITGRPAGRVSAARTVCPMSAGPGSNLGTDAVLPSLATDDASAAPHILAAAARTGTDIELRIHTSITPFDVAAEQWFPAAAGFVVTVLVHTVDAGTGGLRYLAPAEPTEWARAIFSTVGAVHGYFLGAIDPNTGTHRRGQLAYRLYLGTDRQPTPAPRQLVTCPHYLLPGLDGRAEITVTATA
ncbi:hypothetical protein SAMN04490239_1319 [Rhodococcus koreensis]|uniref:N-formylglutamate amidohydrolase n=2 Tax=Nocardiaceae TaxID=85025 RepID=A0A1H4LJF3_9NOCA|nr:hypothetical protein SAMN04490239_1319 [Rhodococcus koreensis]